MLNKEDDTVFNLHLVSTLLVLPQGLFEEIE